jgi:hypothetical protein
MSGHVLCCYDKHSTSASLATGPGKLPEPTLPGDSQVYAFVSRM